MEPSPAFPKDTLSTFFEVAPLHRGEPGDVLVRWPRNRSAPSFALVESPEQLKQAQAESLGPARSAVLKPVGEVPSFFLVAWANLPANREAARQRAYGSGVFFEKTEALTRTVLELRAPAPTGKQAADLLRAVEALSNANELVENLRRQADLSQQMLDATTSELLSGKIGVRQAAQYISAAIAPGAVDLRQTHEEPASAPGPETVGSAQEPSRNPRPRR